MLYYQFWSQSLLPVLSWSRWEVSCKALHTTRSFILSAAHAAILFPMQEVYKKHLASNAWKKQAQDVRAYYRYKCAVCDLDYRKRNSPIQVHHLFYSRFGASIIGREHPYHHFRLLCKDHHPKGKLSNESIQLWRKAYRFRRRWNIVFRFLERWWPK
jgi:hypothetical protein